MPPMKEEPSFIVTASLGKIHMTSSDKKGEVLYTAKKLTLKFEASTVQMFISARVADRPRLAMAEVVQQLATELGRCLAPELKRVFTEPDSNDKPSE